MIRAPGQQPRFHIFVPDVVTGLHLPGGLLNLRAHTLLIGDIGFDGIGDKKIRASASFPGQIRKALFDGRLEPDTERGAGSVRHEHLLAHLPGGQGEHSCRGSLPQKDCLAPR